jgi:hypothetical protein
MASLNQMTDFQVVISDIENYQYTKEEQRWVEEYIGLPLTSKQIYGMYCRYHIRLKPDEMGEGFERKSTNQIRTKRGLPKSLRPLLDPSTDLKKRWSLLTRTLWWYKFVRHAEVDDDVWDVAEEILAKYPNGRKSVLIDLRDSILQRKVVVKENKEKEKDTN